MTAHADCRIHTALDLEATHTASTIHETRTDAPAESICIIGGCGHVGLPLGIVFAEAGARVALVDVSEERVRLVNEGRMPFGELGADVALPRALASGRLRARSDAAGALAEHDVVIVTIGTPVDEYLDPDIRSFDRALDAVLDHMRQGQLLVLRSTVFPGVTDRLAERLARRGLAVDLAYCPERIAQGRALEELPRLPQLVSGTTPAAARRAARLFAMLGMRTIELRPIEAELAKLFCNAFRYINFAISNQFFVIASGLGADFHAIHEAVTADYPRLRGFAGAGLAAGPCLLKDTMQLAAFNHNSFVLGQAAMMVNEGTPFEMVRQLKSRHDLARKRVAILGMAFKGNCDDARSSLSYKLRKLLTLECLEVICTDPYVEDPSLVPLEEALERADLYVLGACHDVYRAARLEKPVLDIFRFLEGTRPA